MENQTRAARQDCLNCLHWLGNEKGCALGEFPCPFSTPVSASTVKSSHSACKGCPYGRDSPCIGWCTKEILRTHESTKRIKDSKWNGP